MKLSDCTSLRKSLRSNELQVENEIVFCAQLLEQDSKGGNPKYSLNVKTDLQKLKPIYNYLT